MSPACAVPAHMHTAIVAFASPPSLCSAYRRLYRAGLGSVQYSTPARYVVRDKLRHAFRHSPITRFNTMRVENTIEFLTNATHYTGIEHRIIKNLGLVEYYRVFVRRKRHQLPEEETAIDVVAFNSYWENIGFLNESLHIDLR